MIDNRHFLQKLQVINGYRIDPYIKSLREFTITEKNEPYSNGYSNEDIDELGFIAEDIHKKNLAKSNLTNVVKKLSGDDIRYKRFPTYAFFDYEESKLVIVNAYNGKIISKR